VARDVKVKLLRANKEAKIVFLDCPYYSTIKYNKQDIHIKKSDKDSNNNKTSDITVHPIRGSLKITSINNKTRNISVNGLKFNKAVDYYNVQVFTILEKNNLKQGSLFDFN
jgi:hypothetical protein